MATKRTTIRIAAVTIQVAVTARARVRTTKHCNWIAKVILETLSIDSIRSGLLVSYSIGLQSKVNRTIPNILGKSISNILSDDSDSDSESSSSSDESESESNDDTKTQQRSRNVKVKS